MKKKIFPFLHKNIFPVISDVVFGGKVGGKLQPNYILKRQFNAYVPITAAHSNLLIPATVQGRDRQKRRISMKDYSVHSTEYRANGDIETEGGGRQCNKMERDCLHILSRQLI